MFCFTKELHYKCIIVFKRNINTFCQFTDGDRMERGSSECDDHYIIGEIHQTSNRQIRLIRSIRVPSHHDYLYKLLELIYSKTGCVTKY